MGLSFQFPMINFFFIGYALKNSAVVSGATGFTGMPVAYSNPAQIVIRGNTVKCQ
jgi:hypothetical protein